MKEFGKDVYIDVVQKNWKQKLGLEVFADLSDLSFSDMENASKIEEQVYEMALNYLFENNLRCKMPLNL